MSTTAARIDGTDDGTDPFVAAVRATRMPMIITNPRLPDNPVVFANDAFCRLSGYERSEILGRNCRFLQGPETDADTVQRLREAVEQRQSIQVDIRNYRKSGETFWNRLLMAPVFDVEGQVLYFFASQVDVTLERERVAGLESANAALMAELADRTRAIEASESRLRAATEAGELGVWELDLASGELFSSTHCKKNFGLDPASPFPYSELLEAVHPDDRDEMRAAVQRTVDGGGDYRIVYRVIRPDGKLAWVRVQGRVELGIDGVPARLAGTSQDVTDTMLAQRRSEILLSLDESAFHDIVDPAEIAYRGAQALGQALDVSRAGYGTIDKVNETITIDRDWNAPGISSIAGILKFRDFGSYIEDLKAGRTVVIGDARLDPRTSVNAEALIGISAQSFINMPVTESGGLVALLFLNHERARHWSDDELALVREVAHRIRLAEARRQAELDLRQMAADLERQVQVRTEELLKTEAALRQAQKMEAVGQLTGGLAHDFNNLLAGMSGSFEVLRRKVKGDPSLDRLIDLGLRSAARAASLTHRLLAFSRQQNLEPKVISVNRLVTDFEDLVRRTIGPQITLEVVTGIGVWPVDVDPVQLESALLNLCINARDAMPDGGRLVIETANRSLDEQAAGANEMEPGQYVSICVSDNGVGMAAHVAGRAFDPFFTTKPLGVGTGLGLSMVYGFTRQSGGVARIYSEVGQGTNVCIYLPRHHGALSSEAQAVAPPETVSGSGETVLVVDDEAAIRELMVDELKDLGYRVLEAHDGRRAIEVLDSGVSINLVVTDVGLPGGLNGRQVAEHARQKQGELPILFVTGYAENAVLSHGHLSPGMQVITKPFELAVFGQRVQAMLLRKRVPDPGNNGGP